GSEMCIRDRSYGQLYPELKRLAQKELISASKPKEGSARGKTRYFITQKGISALEIWLSEPVETESVRLEILLKMYFSNGIKPEIMKKHITEFSISHQKQLDMLNMFQQQLLSVEDLHSNHGDILSVIDFGQKVYKAYIDWCEETTIYLESRDEK
ncbi:MAG TPA: hypothetical protein DD730_01400, partial [Desulfosporosinus sp.]|nr:hypothetical protein [Desulfosporosinus sp.]